MRLTFVILAALAMFLTACSDDDSGSATGGTTTDDTRAITPTGEVDTEQLTEDLRNAVMGEDSEPYDPPLEVKEAGVTTGGTDGLIIAPVDPTDSLTQEQADQVCAAATTVVLRELPTAVAIVADGDGTPMAANNGPAGSCEATTESVDEILSVE